MNYTLPRSLLVGLTATAVSVLVACSGGDISKGPNTIYVTVNNQTTQMSANNASTNGTPAANNSNGGPSVNNQTVPPNRTTTGTNPTTNGPGPGNTTSGTNGPTNPTTNSGGDGNACNNDADLEAVTSPDNATVTQACALMCIAESDLHGCIATCVQTEIAVSPACSECVADLAECGVANCFNECESPNSEQCVQCLEPVCEADFQACAGIPSRAI